MSLAADAGEYIEGIDENMILQGIRIGIKKWGLALPWQGKGGQQTWQKLK